MGKKFGLDVAVDPEHVVSANTLIVVASPDGNGVRIYWKGVRLNGRIDHSGSMRKSMTHPRFTMVIDGHREQFGNDNLMAKTFVFRGEVLTCHGGGFAVDYDEATDQLVF